MKDAKGITEKDKLVIRSISKCLVGIHEVEVTESGISCAASFLELWDETKVREL